MDRVVNLKLLSHPANWAIVWIVLLFGAIAFSFVHKTVTVTPQPQSVAS